jgi:3-oxoacyl-[acyl-carrier protein] reductase
MTEGLLSTAVVTGAGRGIGRALALGLAAAGATVVVAGRSAIPLDETVRLITDRGGRALAVPSDVTDWDSVNRLADRSVEFLGAPALWVNNAGGSRAVGPLLSMSHSEWWEDIELNLKSAMMCSRACIPLMTEAGGGRVINIGSGAGVQPWEGIGAYSCAKAALIVMGEVVDAQTKQCAVRVFTLSPGLVRTPSVGDVLATERGQQYMQALAALPDSAYLPVELVVDHVVAIGSGRVDALAGRYLHASDNLEDLLARQDEIVGGDKLVLRLAQ